MYNYYLLSQNASIVAKVRATARAVGHRLQYYDAPALLLRACQAQPPDVLLVDSTTPGVFASDYLEQLRAYCTRCIIIGLSAMQMPWMPQDTECLESPLQAGALEAALARVLASPLPLSGAVDIYALQGQQLGTLRVEQRLGDDTHSAVVYRARDTHTGRTLALKFFGDVAFDREEGGMPELTLRKRFAREATIASKLDHPNIYQVYGLEHLADGTPYLLMEFVAGQTLQQKLTERLSLAQALDYGLQIADGLAHAHAHKITHRDVKPSNIMCLPDGGIKLLDFGVAKALEPTNSLQEQLTKHGMVLGTMRYMAPEQIEGHPTDVRVDCWAFGIILYEMLSGQHPFAHAVGMVGLINAILYQAPPPLQRPDLPPLLTEMLGDMLHKDPERRYPSAQTIAEDLREVLHTLEDEDTKA